MEKSDRKKFKECGKKSFKYDIHWERSKNGKINGKENETKKEQG